MGDKRDFDIVVFGATGFTGGLVAEYLAKRTQPGLRWAIAGRSRERLAEVQRRIEAIDATRAPALIEADNRDHASLVRMARAARVVLTTVGPYADGGEALVRACIEAGADYVDITGEPDFVSALLERHDESARRAGVRIVNCCGFDSVPHDLGVLLAVRQLGADGAVTVEGFVRARGAPSGGTWASAINAFAELRHARRGRRAPRPADAGEKRVVRALPPRFRYDRRVGGWVFPLPTIDGQIVRRSARALGYGREFAYGHYGLSRSLPRILLGAAGLTAVIALAQLGPTRRRLLAMRPSGQGPSAKQRERSWFEATFIARAGDRSATVRVSGGDPGYSETSKMVAESALCLALDRDRLPARAGILTPAVAMGEGLIDRLRAAGLRFEVIEPAGGAREPAAMAS
jgi:short subunit dehydrogenase-like uncharacterized protein